MTGAAGSRRRPTQGGGDTRALELFCGIGGFAAAVAGTGIQVVGAIDQSPAALAVYCRNFPGHNGQLADLEKITPAVLAGFDADMWWLSPPCQPYSVRGHGHDLDDPRARSLAAIIQATSELSERNLPDFMVLENVAGFATSRARAQLLTLLAERGYVVRERQLCPTELGIPSRRPRYYLIASRVGLNPQRPVAARFQALGNFLDPQLSVMPPSDLLVAAEIVERFGEGFRILDPLDISAYTTCFTAGYGKSLMHAGSYLRCSDGVRRFAPQEIARLLGFPEEFCFPAKMPVRGRWRLLGNSLSVSAVREVLTALPIKAGYPRRQADGRL